MAFKMSCREQSDLFYPIHCVYLVTKSSSEMWKRLIGNGRNSEQCPQSHVWF